MIIDYTAIANAETNPDAATQMVTAMVAMVTNGVTINGTQTTAAIVIGNTTGNCETSLSNI